MQAGEKQTFLKYLLEQKLYIDMWDGDSMLLIGSTSTPLKYLLRQSQPAVQVSQELDVVYTEYAEDHPMLAGDINKTGLPTGIKVCWFFLTVKLVLFYLAILYDIFRGLLGTVENIKPSVRRFVYTSGFLYVYLFVCFSPFLIYPNFRERILLVLGVLTIYFET